MRRIKDILIITTILLMVSCSKKIKQVEAFHSVLDSSDIEGVITMYFDYPDDANMDQMKSFHTPVFDKIKSNIALGSYEVLTFREATSKWDNVAKLTASIKPSKICVVKYANGEFLYVRLSGKKIQSLIPILKGNVISGWM